jgi:hypothetical protein
VEESAGLCSVERGLAAVRNESLGSKMNLQIEIALSSDLIFLSNSSKRHRTLTFPPLIKSRRRREFWVECLRSRIGGDLKGWASSIPLSPSPKAATLTRGFSGPEPFDKFSVPSF